MLFLRHCNGWLYVYWIGKSDWVSKHQEQKEKDCGQITDQSAKCEQFLKKVGSCGVYMNGKWLWWEIYVNMLKTRLRLNLPT